MKKYLILAVLIGAGVVANAQTLLYQWAFTNSADTFTNSAASYAWTPGTGDLLLQNVSGSVYGTVGTDAVNPLSYFTNAAAGPGFGPGVDAMGALVANGQGYSGGNTAIGMVTNLNLGTLNQITVTFWVKMGSSVSVGPQFPRFVQFYQTPAYDAGGKGSGNHNGLGTSLNGWSGTTASQFQNGIASASLGSDNQITFGGNPALAPGFQADGTTWYFEAITYDGTSAANNFITWIGTLNTNVQPFIQSLNYSSINFTTNATVMIGGNDLNTQARSLSSGAIADVRIYSGVLTSNMLENIRTFQPDGVIPPGAGPATVISQPASGNTFKGGSRTFSVTANGNPAVFTYQWRSNNVAIAGATNTTFTVSNVQLAASGASFVCSVTNIYGGTNSQAAVLTVVTPTTGSYAAAVLTNNPYSFWLVNEASNSAAITLYDYVNGYDGQAMNPSNNVFAVGPESPLYVGFPATNSAIESIPARAGQLNLASPVNYTNTGMTICGWVNTPGLLTGTYGLIFNLAESGAGFGLTAGGNDGVRNQLNYQWGLASVSSGLYFNTNEWTFIAVTISTNLTDVDVSNGITADTNAVVYLGSHSTGFLSFTNSTALNGAVMPCGVSVSPLALGRSTIAASEGSYFYAVNDAQFNSVAVFYSALSSMTVSNMYMIGAGSPTLTLSGVPDVSTPGNFKITWSTGVLQEATVVTGPYTDVSGATSPYSVPMTDAQHYYRLRN